MKTLLSILMIVVLIVAATSLDAARLDAGDWFITLAVAALFGMALNDSGRRPVYYVHSALRTGS